MRNKLILFVMLLSLVNCQKSEQIDKQNSKDAKIIEVAPTLKSKLVLVLEENQKIHELLMNESGGIPDVTSLRKRLSEAKIEVKQEELQLLLQKMQKNLEKIDTQDKKKFFTTYSDFSVSLANLNAMTNLNAGFHKFHCPMVAKYWVAKGKKIQNPYAPEMRECGELIK
ncbi:MAG: hypothetical protein AAF518_25935 [Spirochaetota bacterium]